METLKEFRVGIDRCDRCGSQAYHAATKDGKELLFCVHHMNIHRNKLLQLGWSITTDTDRLKNISLPAPVV